MSIIDKFRYLLDRKTKISLIGIFLIILFGSAIELMAVTIVLPIVNLAIDADFRNNKYCEIAMQLTGLEKREDILLFLTGSVNCHKGISIFSPSATIKIVKKRIDSFRILVNIDKEEKQ